MKDSTISILTKSTIIVNYNFFSGQISRQNNPNSWKSWVSSNHTSLWILRRVFTQIRQHYCLAILHWNLRLFESLCHHWRTHFLRTWRLIAQHSDFRSNSYNRPQTGGSSWWTYVWLVVVWSRRHSGLGRQPSRRRVRFEIPFTAFLKKNSQTKSS